MFSEPVDPEEVLILLLKELLTTIDDTFCLFFRVPVC